MLRVRWAVMFLLLGAVVCGALYIGTGDARYRTWGVRLLKWVVVAGLAFFGVLILERLA